MKRILWVLPILATLCGMAGAITRYVAPTAGTFGGSGVCNGQTAITPATLTTTTNSAGDIIWFCNATFTASGGGTVAKILGSGTSGSPITINLDAGAIIQAPYCNASNGCLDIDGLSWIVVNVPSGTGTIQNTANGDALANQQISRLIYANACNNCTIENLTLPNNYIATPRTAVVSVSGSTVTYTSGNQFNTTWQASGSCPSNCPITIGPAATCTVANTSGCDTCGLLSSPSATSLTLNGCTPSTPSGSNLNFEWALGGSATQLNAIYLTGQNDTITGNTIHDCGWCIYIPYATGDTNLQVLNNEIYNWDHNMMFAAAGAWACSAPCLTLQGNRIHDNVNWETIGCVYHLDGLHTFGVVGSTMNGQYIDNNYFYGSLSGPCSSGFLFMEQGSPSQSNASNTYIWNNVFDASNADGVNPNGWVGVFSGVGGVTQVMYNTLLCPSSTDGSTVGWGLQQQGANLTFEGNVENKCPQGNSLTKGSGTLTLDYNAYGNPCSGTSNCWVNPAGVTFQGSFSAWKTACSCDSHSFTTATDIALKLNSDGSPQTGSPVIQQGVNLTSTGTGNLASLLLDTTKGGTRASLSRPTGTCTVQGTTSCWDEGAYQFSAASNATPPAPATGLFADISYLDFLGELNENTR